MAYTFAEMPNADAIKRRRALAEAMMVNPSQVTTGGWGGLVQALGSVGQQYAGHKIAENADQQLAERNQMLLGEIAKINDPMQDTLFGADADTQAANRETARMQLAMELDPGAATERMLDEIWDDPEAENMVEVYDPATGGKKWVRESEAYNQPSEAPESFSPDYETMEDGNETVTFYTDANGKRVEVARAPRWQPQQPAAPDYQEAFLTPEEIEAARLAPGTVAERREGGITILQQPDDGGDETERTREIARLVDQGIDRVTAERVADGVVKLTNPDANGNVYAIDLATNESKIVAGPLADIETPEAPDGQTESYETTVETGAGMGQTVAAGLEGTIGAVFDMVSRGLGGDGGMVAPEINNARNNIRNINQTIRDALAQSDKFVVEEQKQITDLLPNPDALLSNTSSVVQQAADLRAFLETKIVSLQTLAANPRASNDARIAAQDKAATIEMILGLMGPKPGSGGGSGGTQDLLDAADAIVGQ